MGLTVFAGMDEKAIYFYKDGQVNRVCTPDTCFGIRSLALSDGNVYIACSKSNEIWRYAIKSNRFIKLCNCIGSYPCKIIIYNNYYIIACCDTDTVEIYHKESGEGLISLKLGTLISDLFVIDNICYAICTLSCELFALKLPELKIVSYRFLDYHPNAFVANDNLLTIIGSETKWGRIERIDCNLNVIYQSQTASSPTEATVQNNNVLIFGLRDNIICNHMLSTLNLINSYKVTQEIELLSSFNGEIFIKNNNYITILNCKKRRTYKVLPFNYQLSCIAFDDTN